MEDLALAQRLSTGYPFRNVADMSRAVYSSGNSGYRSAKSLSSPLGQILRGKRPCPEQLAASIRLAIRERAKSLTIETADEVIAGYECLLAAPGGVRKSVGLSQVKCRRADFSAVLRCIRDCRQAYTMFDGVIPDNSCGRGVLFEMLRRLPSSLPGEVEFIVFVSSPDQANAFWNRIQKLSGEVFEAVVASKMLASFLRENAPIRVLNIDSDSFYCPYIIFDPSSPARRGFNLYFEEDMPALCPMSKAWVQHWNESYLHGTSSNLLNSSRIYPLL